MLRPRVRSLLPLVLGLALGLGQGVTATALAGDCGGAVPCACGDTVVANRTLDATDPVTTLICPCDGLSVAAGVTLDLGGRTIRGDHVCVGIVVESGASNVTVMRGRIFSFLTGLTTDASTKGHFLNLEVAHHGDGGGFLIDGGENVVEKNTVHGNASEGITAGGSGNAILSNQVRDNGGHGIRLLQGTGNTVARNVVKNNAENGLDIDGVGHAVDRNRVTDNDGNGMKVGGTGHTVTSNITSLNGRTPEQLHGILVDAESTLFARNRSDQNGGFGMKEEAPNDNTYTLNICNANGLGDSDPHGLCR